MAVSINLEQILKYPALPPRAVGTLPKVAAGISLIAAGGGGLYWLVAGLALGFAGGVLNAWILLAEIHR